ncbi:acyltransferase family protein [Paraburkholderia silviterrae]|uniref:Acyltransferase n=1 Tax=Paraburkholderia silviterrae TaxID=2528715 RepID=A0A4R5MED8_9BURK|nr:acyltransferase [Paraburkholderia silviterrae]TDG25490.1 acyltransferase [Paraburkholderia silviterrae]
MTGLERRVKGLDGLRALAVMLVFLAHKAHVEAIDAGKIGVWLFFLISGYLIIGELHRNRLRVEQRTARRDALLYVFFVKRALRIFPVYYLLLVALTIAHACFYQRDVDLGLAWHYVFLSNFWIGIVHDGWPGTVSHFWSLAVEQQFYLIAPFALLFTRASRHLAICIAMILAAALAHLALYASGAIEPLVYAFSPWNFALLALGGVLAIGGARAPAAHGGGRVQSGIGFVLACASLAAFALARADCDACEAAQRAILPGLLDIGLALSLGAVLLWLVRHQDSLLVAALEARPLAYLGTISYGFYLFHNLVPSRLGEASALYTFLHVPPLAQDLLPLVIQFALSVLLAHLSWQLLEKRVLEWKEPLATAIRSRLPARAAAGPT